MMMIIIITIIIIIIFITATIILSVVAVAQVEIRAKGWFGNILLSYITSGKTSKGWSKFISVGWVMAMGRYGRRRIDDTS